LADVTVSYLGLYLEGRLWGDEEIMGTKVSTIRAQQAQSSWRDNCENAKVQKCKKRSQSSMKKSL
jgi:hypothetical protein